MEFFIETMLWILIFTLFSAAQGDFICTVQRLTVASSCGDAVILPCNFAWRGPPPTSTYELVWQVRQRGVDYVVHDDDLQTPANQQQNAMFTNRTYVSEGWSRHGNATLQITDVTERDNGLYTCDLLTTRPFAREICTEVQLIVNTDSVNCGTNESLTIASGESVQLPCLRRHICLPHNKREIHWRFKASNSETEQELPYLAIAEDGRIAAHANGTLILQKVYSSDSGTYCCYLKGTEMCSGFHLQVFDVATEDLGPKSVLEILVVAVFGIVVVVVGVGVAICWKSRREQKKTDRKSLKTGAGMPNVVAEHRQKDAQIDIHDENAQDSVTSMTKLLHHEKTWDPPSD